MKHLSKLLALLLIAGALIACSKDEVPEPNQSNIQFPDAKFAAYMVMHFDTNGDGGISPAEAAAITKIECQGLEIESLEGIEYCTELTYLDCGYHHYEYNNIGYRTYNKLTSLNVSKNTKLTYLICGSNQLTSLDVSNNTELTRLSCGENPITTLDISNNTELTWLWCAENQLTSLDVSKNTKLIRLDCGNINSSTYRNQLTSLDVSNNTELTYLHCSSNRLTALDVSNNTKLTYLYCFNNQLTTLDVSKNTELTYLTCYNNQLTSLDVSKTNLGNSYYADPLFCNMASLQTLYLKTGWQLKGINKDRDQRYIHSNTKIEYKD